MTVGIGVLASDKQQKPDTIILIADTKGTFGSAYSMNRLHKIFKDDEVKTYAVAADRIDRGAELFTILTKLRKETFTQKTYDDLAGSVHAASDVYKRARFRYDVLPRHAHVPLSLPHTFTEQDLTPQLLEEWRQFDFRCQMIIGIVNLGQAYLFRIDGKGGVEHFTFPGFAAIGSGASPAMLWLCYRNHNMALSVKHAAYHAFEAKLMAETSPFVNEKVEMLIADEGGSFSLHDFRPASKNAKFTLTDLRGMFAKYGPRSTSGLTKFKP